MLLYYIRHGDPIYEPDSLTPLGHQQAEALAQRLALYGFDEIYSSTSTRAIMTAEPTCKRLNKAPILLAWANEGLAWERFALPNEQEQKRWAFHSPKWIKAFNDPQVTALNERWYEHSLFAEYSLKENVLAANSEIDEFLRSLGFEHDRSRKCYAVNNLKKPEQRIALFAHQGFGMTFLSSIMDLPYSYFSTHFDISHSCVTVIQFSENQPICYPKILQLSNDSHLFKAGLMQGYNGSLKI